MNYKIYITRTEPNENIEKEQEQYDRGMRGGYRNNGDYPMPPMTQVTKDVLMVELTEEQFKSVKAEVLKVF